jgi:Bax protein
MNLGTKGRPTMHDAKKPATGNSHKLVFALLLASLFHAAFLIDPPRAPLVLVPETAPLGATPVATRIEVQVPDFAAMANVEMKKQAFFDFLQPYVDAQNQKVQQQRARLQVLIDKIAHGLDLNSNERVFIHALSVEYEIAEEDYHTPGYLERLLRRVDVLPPSLVLAQAANESAWGTSRFAQEANNFFGQWCYSEGCGLVPSRRRSSASHEVKAFDSVEAAVSAYFQNLNTFPSYLNLRLIRESLREKAQPIDGISLTEGLARYSERGEAYIDELQALIYYNELLERDKLITPELQD